MQEISDLKRCCTKACCIVISERLIKSYVVNDEQYVSTKFPILKKVVYNPNLAEAIAAFFSK